jgi:hypothetical protein
MTKIYELRKYVWETCREDIKSRRSVLSLFPPGISQVLNFGAKAQNVLFAVQNLPSSKLMSSPRHILNENVLKFALNVSMFLSCDCSE